MNLAAQTNAFQSSFRYNSDSSLQPINFRLAYFKTNGNKMGPKGFDPLAHRL